MVSGCVEDSLTVLLIIMLSRVTVSFASFNDVFNCNPSCN